MNRPLLDQIDGPETLKKLSPAKLRLLATEIRQRIIEVMSLNGGHLGSNLGTVELSIALHKVFHSPKDRFIWDVSHQSYTHKLLTGRNARFDTIRQHEGLCGFSHPKESPHDHFHAGHAGTALSLALGVAASREIEQEDFHVIPIIGDATLTCGLSLEALNNIPSDLKKYIVILNDNRMSISKNVGAITHILSRFLSNPTTHRISQEIKNFLSKVPSIGGTLSKQGKKLTESLKNLVSPAVFFEEFGLSYIGPIDGHDLDKLIDTFERVKHSPTPVIIHVMTNKGEGMPEAIENPVSYHGVKPFDIESGKMYPQTTQKPTFPKIFGDHLLEMGKKDPSIVVITPAMIAGSQITSFYEQFKERCFDVGIAESHAVTFAGGLAKSGKCKVIVSIYATFLQRAFDNLFHDICIQELPVVFCVDRAGISGPDGTTHHGIYDLSFLNAMPHMVICQPRDGTLLKELLDSAFSWEKVVAIRYPNLPTFLVDRPMRYLPLGKGEVILEGKEILILALGHMHEMALEIVVLLQEKGFSPTLFDPIFIKPLDENTLKRLLSTHSHLVTLEEHSSHSGIGAILNHFIAQEGIHLTTIQNFGIPEMYVQHGSNNILLKELGLSAPLIAEKVIQKVHENKHSTLDKYAHLSSQKSN